MIHKTETAPQKSIPSWMDGLTGMVIVLITLATFLYGLSSGVVSISLFDSEQWAWFIVRAAGLSSFLLLAASMVWGVFLSSHIVKSWVPGPVSLLLHATTSWLAVVLSLAHIGLLLFDNYYVYTLSDLLIPFTGPYRPFAVGLGIVAFWIIIAVTISFSLRKFMSRRAWLWLHYTSYFAFGLIAAHGVLAGTDATRPAVVIILGASSVIVAALLGLRLRQTWLGKHDKNVAQQGI